MDRIKQRGSNAYDVLVRCGFFVECHIKFRESFNTKNVLVEH